jgi:hypothetical protein
MIKVRDVWHIHLKDRVPFPRRAFSEDASLCMRVFNLILLCCTSWRGCFLWLGCPPSRKSSVLPWRLWQWVCHPVHLDRAGATLSQGFLGMLRITNVLALGLLCFTSPAVVASYDK